MSSTTFEKVISTTAPRVFATFPPQTALPVPSSTLCCLSFSDRFLTQYPSAEDETGERHECLEKYAASSPRRIAVTITDVDFIMKRAAGLGKRLMMAFAGKLRPRVRDVAGAAISDLLTKVRGIFGNRLTPVGRDIRVLRDERAVQDDIFLLRQLHALNNATMEVCGRERWCIIVTAGYASWAVCALPPMSLRGTVRESHFLVFDPLPRVKEELRGSSVVSFTTIRGLQLHILSAMREAWGRTSEVNAGELESDMVGLSLVVSAQGSPEANFNAEARKVLGERDGRHYGKAYELLSTDAPSVMNIRRVEKAAAIKAKRMELENLRKAIAVASGQEAPTVMAPIAGGPREMPHESGCADSDVGGRDLDTNKTMSLADPPENPGERGWVDEPAHRPHLEEHAEANGPEVSIPEEANYVGSPLVSSSSTRRQGDAMRLDGEPEEMDNQLDQTDVLQIVDKQNFRYREPARHEVHGSPDCERGNFGRLTEQRAGCQDREIAPGSTEDEGAGSISVPSQGDGSGERAECCSEESQDQGVEMEPIESESPSLLPRSRSEGYPLHRRLLRSIKGERLVEYSVRAYNIYRTEGVSLQQKLENQRAPVAPAGMPLLPCPLESSHLDARSGEEIVTKLLAAPASGVTEDRMMLPGTHGGEDSSERTMEGYNATDGSLSPDAKSLISVKSRPEVDCMKSRASCWQNIEKVSPDWPLVPNACVDVAEGNLLHEELPAYRSGPFLGSLPLPLPATVPANSKVSACDSMDTGVSCEATQGVDEGERVTGVTRLVVPRDLREEYSVVADGRCGDKHNERTVIGAAHEGFGEIPSRQKVDLKVETVAPSASGVGTRAYTPPVDAVEAQGSGGREGKGSLRRRLLRGCDEVNRNGLGAEGEKITVETAARRLTARGFTGDSDPQQSPRDLDESAVVGSEEVDASPDPALEGSHEPSKPMAVDQVGGERTPQGHPHDPRTAFLLQLKIMRQRGIIERAQRMRDEDDKSRRARIGAQVFKEVKRLRGSGALTDPACAHSTQQQPPSPRLLGSPRLPIPDTDTDKKKRGMDEIGSDRVSSSAMESLQAPEALGSTGAACTGHIASPRETPRAMDLVHTEGGVSWRGERHKKARQDCTPGTARLGGCSFDIPTDDIRLYEEEGRREGTGRYPQQDEKNRGTEEKSGTWRQGQEAERDGNCRATHHASAGAVDTASGHRGHRRLIGEDAHEILKSSDGYAGVLAPPPSRSLARKDPGRISDRCDSQGAGDGKVGSRGQGNDWGGSRASKGFSPLSNRKLVRNAIKFLCLAGDHVKDRKARVLETLDRHEASNFLLLLAHTKLLTFKGLYACDASQDTVAEKILGLGPPRLDISMLDLKHAYAMKAFVCSFGRDVFGMTMALRLTQVSGLYKYNSAAREFRKVHSKTFAKTTDAASVEPTKLRRTKATTTQPSPSCRPDANSPCN